MRRRLLPRCLFLGIACVFAAVTMSAMHASEPPDCGEQSDWHGYVRYDFEVDGRPVLSRCGEDAVAPGRPWVWHGEFFGHKPTPDIALLGRGISRRLHNCPRYAGKSTRGGTLERVLR
ncbi:MAG: hypothetical protein R3C19_03300 [Planctomycetaceae bacterium]